MSRITLVTGGMVGTMFLALSSVGAAELSPPYPRAYAPAQCGPCGCLGVTYVHHRELRSTYGLSYDPRNYDTTQPHYYFGPMKAYPRYFVDGVPISGSC